MFGENSDPDLVAQIVADMASAPPEASLGAFEAVLKSYPTSTVLKKLKVPIVTINTAGWVPTNIEGANRAGMEVIVSQIFFEGTEITPRLQGLLWGS